MCAPYLPLLHCHAPWERASLKCSTAMRLGNARALNARLGQQRLSLHLRPTAHREQRDMWQCQSPPQRGVGIRSRRTRGNTGALFSGEAGSEAAGHVAAPEPSSAWRWVKSRGTRGSIRTLSREVRSGAAGHMTAPEPSLTGRRGLELQDTWQHWSPP
jgi:hypothetical protein